MLFDAVTTCTLEKLTPTTYAHGRAQESQLPRSGLCFSSTPKDKGHTFEDNKVLDRENRWFERGFIEAIYIKIFKKL